MTSSTDKSKVDEIYNFVTNLDIGIFEDVKRDLDLYYKGYDFFYVVDTYDIIRYFRPFTEKDFFKIEQDNKNRLANEILAYDWIYTFNQFKNIIIPTEYKVEILQKEKDFSDRVRTFSQNGNLRKILSKIEDKKLLDAEREEFIQNNAEVLITLLILADADGPGNKSILEFIQGRILPSQASAEVYNTGSEGEDREILDYDDNLIEYIYDQFVTLKTPYLLTLESDLDRYKYLNASYSDIQVIERVRRLNMIAQERAATGKKEIFIYLSSVRQKSADIFSILINARRREYRLPAVDGYAFFNYYRNISQRFLFIILTLDFPRNRENAEINAKEADEILSLIIKLAEQRKSMPENPADPLFLKFRKMLDKYAVAIDNHFYLNVYEKYRDIYTSKKSEMLKRAEIVKVLSYMEKYLNDKLFKGDIKSNILKYRQTHTIASLADLAQDVKVSIKVPFGHDIIRNNFQHLPNLLFLYNPQKDPDFVGILFLITQVTYHEGEENVMDEIRLLIRKVFVDKDFSNSLYPDLDTLISAYLNIFFLPGQTAEHDNEVETIHVLNKLKRVSRSAGMRPMTVKDEGNEKLTGVVSESATIPEIDYILLWLYRRNKRIDDAITLGERLVKKAPDDARFSHGLALALIAKIYTVPGMFDHAPGNGDREWVTDELKRVMTLLEKSMTGYGLVLEREENMQNQWIIRAAIVGTLNSFVSTKIKLYALGDTEDRDLLAGARRDLENIKLQFGHLGVEYDQYKIYSVTEAELEYYEAKSFYTQGDVGKANTKILHATNRINGIKYAKRSHMYPQFLVIRDKINYIRNQIFRERGII